MNLYWSETDDHDEDWFIVAPSAKAACRWHVQAEGYDPQDVRATLVLRIPKQMAAHIGWPDLKLLRALGAVLL
jgi:hypothetical protein